jgi:hypothetical protein
MKKNLLKILLLFIFVLGAGITGDFIKTKFFSTPSEENIQSFLLATAEEINKQCPMTVDADTRLDNVAILSNKTLQYNYTLINQEKKDFDLRIIENKFFPQLLNNAKTSPGLKPLRDFKDGVYITHYKIRPQQYLN